MNHIHLTDDLVCAPRNVVAIGGGTGLSILLKGLKGYVRRRRSAEISGTDLPSAISSLTAVVTVTDDGGSSGRLRKEFNILPPGDIRNCLVALSEDEPLLSKLFQYRFTSGSGLEGHSFGNLFVTALTGITGDFAVAVQHSSAILKTRGTIYPATTSNVQLDALMDDGTHVLGETSITRSKKRIVDLRLIPPDVHPLPQTLEAIAGANLIVVGPGSLFTSIIPNFLVRGIPEAIASSSAIKVYVCNLMTQANESLGLSAADHVRAICDHAGVQAFDYALVNVRPVSAALKKSYASQDAAQIAADVGKIESLGVKPLLGDYLEEAGGTARHATDRVARDLMSLLVTHKKDRNEPKIPARRASRAKMSL